MNRLTRAKAIKEHCLECMGCDLRRAKLIGREPCGNGPVQAAQMVRECEDKFCSNYNYRTGRETTPGMKKRIVAVNVKNALHEGRKRQKEKHAQLHA
jgi:hypothetical protein